MLAKISQGGSERLYVYVHAFQMICENKHNVNKKFNDILKCTSSESCIDS